MFLQMRSTPREAPLVNSGRGVPSHMSWSMERKPHQAHQACQNCLWLALICASPLAKSEARLLSSRSGNGNQLLAHSAIALELRVAHKTE